MSRSAFFVLFFTFFGTDKMQVRSTPPLKDVTLTEYDCYCSLRYVFSLTLHDVMLIKIGNTEKLPIWVAVSILSHARTTPQIF